MARPKFHGRTKPYMQLGLRQVPCARCGKPSSYQWQACSNDRRYMGFCTDCDVLINALVLAFCGFKNREELMEWYCKSIDCTSTDYRPMLNLEGVINGRRTEETITL